MCKTALVSATPAASVRPPPVMPNALAAPPADNSRHFQWMDDETSGLLLGGRVRQMRHFCRVGVAAAHIAEGPGSAACQRAGRCVRYVNPELPEEEPEEESNGGSDSAEV